MNDTLKPKIKYYCKFLIQYGINEFKNLLVFILLFSKSLLLLSFTVMFSDNVLCCVVSNAGGDT